MLLAVTLKPSRKLVLAGFLLYALALSAILIASLPIFLTLVLITLVAMNGSLYFRRYLLLKHPQAIVAMAKAGAFWSLRLANNEVLTAELKQNSLVTHFLMVMNFKCQSSSHLTAILSPECTGLENYRQLLVLLKYSR